MATASPSSRSAASFRRRGKDPTMPDSPHIMIVEAPYYAHIAEELMRGAIQALDGAGASYERFTVPGAFEIPAAIRIAIEARGHDVRRGFDDYIALGCVIRDETTHYDYVCATSASRLQKHSLHDAVPLDLYALSLENTHQTHWGEHKAR